jgi:hypothetical protein
LGLVLHIEVTGEMPFIGSPGETLESVTFEFVRPQTASK